MKIKTLFVMLFASAVLLAQQSTDSKSINDLKDMPSPKTAIKPVYPQVAKLAGVQGKVFVEATIDEKGNVVNTKILKSDHETLEAAALEAIKKTKFNPGVSKTNKKVKATVVIPIMFKLEEGDKGKSEQLKDEKNISQKDRTPIIGPGIQRPAKDEVDPDIDANVEFEKSPKMINPAKPDYPEEAKEKKITGKVFVKVLIDREGSPKKAVVIKSDSELFNQPAIDAVLKSTFSPALQKGKPIAVWVVLPYKFTLDEGGSKETPKQK